MLVMLERKLFYLNLCVVATSLSSMDAQRLSASLDPHIPFHATSRHHHRTWAG